MFATFSVFSNFNDDRHIYYLSEKPVFNLVSVYYMKKGIDKDFLDM